MRSINIQNITDRHQIIMHLMASGQYTNVEIAQKVGVSREYISQLTHHSPLFQAELEIIRQGMRKQLMSRALDKLVAETDASLDKIIEVRDDPNASKSLQAKMALELLDRNPATAKWNKNIGPVSSEPVLTEDQVALLAQTFQMDPTAQLALQQAREMLNNIDDELPEDNEATDESTPTINAPVSDRNTDNSPNGQTMASGPVDSSNGHNGDILGLFDIADDLGV